MVLLLVNTYQTCQALKLRVCKIVINYGTKNHPWEKLFKQELTMNDGPRGYFSNFGVQHDSYVWCNCCLHIQVYLQCIFKV